MSNLNITINELIWDIDNISDSISDKSKNEVRNYFDQFKDWIKKFVLADLQDMDKIEILKYCKDSIVRFRPFCDDQPLNTFIKMVARNRIIDAVEISRYMAFEYDEKKEYVRHLVKQKPVYILSPKLDMEMGGLGHIVVHRANYLANQGYDVTILNAGPIKDYKFIKNFYENQNPLFKKVKFHNYIQYYSFKNSTSYKNPTLDNVLKQFDEKIQKKVENDKTVTLTYYDDNDEVIKTERYIDDCLAFRDDNDFGSYYTPDGFKYLELNKSNNHVYLHERESDITLEFNHKNVFLNHFLTEVCLLDDANPFIICDSTTHWYHMNAVSLNKAIKIGCLHGSAFIDFDPKKGLNPNVNHLNRIERYHKIVVLTERQKNDLESFVDIDKLTVIPNFINDEFLDDEECQKDLNKIAIFTRIAPIKQISHMVEALNMISDENKNVHLDIYGETETPIEDEELIFLKDLIKKYGLEDRIRFRGYINDVHSEMKKTFFTLLTSKMEGFSVSTIELMANSVPIISYDIRYGPSDLISNNIDGVLIDKDDISGLAKTMLKFLNNPEDTLQMGMKAKEKIRNHFTRTKVCTMWEDLFMELFIENEMKRIIEKLDLKDDYNSISKRNNNLENEIKILKKENEDLRQFQKDVLSSRSWKITKPLRKIKK